jgi:hypothetical protein
MTRENETLCRELNKSYFDFSPQYGDILPVA